MENDIVLKMNRSGLTVFINPDLTYGECCEKIREKFRTSARFFGNSEMAVELSGHNLSSAEALGIIDIIKEETEIKVLAVVNDSESDNLLYDRALKAFTEKLAEDVAVIHRGNITSEEDLDFKESVLVIGSVAKGGKIHSNGSIYVLGELSGSAYAGELGNAASVIYASAFNAENAIIADVSYRSPIKNKNTKNEKHGLSFKKQKEEEDIRVKNTFLRIVDGEVVAEELCLETKATV